jgi:hypothetical protein
MLNSNAEKQSIDAFRLNSNMQSEAKHSPGTISRVWSNSIHLIQCGSFAQIHEGAFLLHNLPAQGNSQSSHHAHLIVTFGSPMDVTESTIFSQDISHDMRACVRWCENKTCDIS